MVANPISRFSRLYLLLISTFTEIIGLKWKKVSNLVAIQIPLFWCIFFKSFASPPWILPATILLHLKEWMTESARIILFFVTSYNLHTRSTISCFTFLSKRLVWWKYPTLQTCVSELQLKASSIFTHRVHSVTLTVTYIPFNNVIFLFYFGPLPVQEANLRNLYCCEPQVSHFYWHVWWL